MDEGSGFKVWQQVDDFFASGPHDPHYILDRTTGTVRFGSARIPSANPSNAGGNIVARAYRFGGGAAGNVGASAVSVIENFVEGIQGVTNSVAAAGGSDEETVGDETARAPGFEIA